MEGPVSLISRTTADRIGKPGDRSGIGARQAGDDLIDECADPSDSGERRTSASRTDPSARFAAAATASRRLSLQGGPRPIAACTISSSDSESRRNADSASGLSAKAGPAGATR